MCIRDRSMPMCEKRPSSATEILDFSSDIKTTIASVYSEIPRAALCRVPISGSIILLSVRGKIHAAASIKSF